MQDALLFKPERMEAEVWFVCATCGRRYRTAACYLVFPPPVCDHRPAEQELL